jgi:tetratricopeptide (TPR) repeat protein
MGIIQMINALVTSKKWQAVIASVITILCLGVPAQMASQNWDDHDRSNRYVARDFGANYLNSCEEDAIIFCNGDNDTFPLWYNIEVEGERTDVRACNLSYLQTDWYIDQMKRPYYESPALPISWEYKDYMEGKNDMVPVVDRKNGKPLAVDQAFKFLHSNEKSTKIEGEDYIPAAQLYIPSPVDTLFLKKASYFNRSEMMVMEMLSTNKWKRPMYFAATVGNDYHLGLDPYLELTGLAYRITDTRSPDGHPRVNTEVMYDNMMNKFKFGNVNKPGIYLDENTMRMCHTHRSMFVRLAEALCQEGNEAEFWYNENYEIEDSLAMIDKYEKALKVLDYAEEVLPAYNIPYDNYSIGMAELYCQLGKPDKGLPIFDALANRSVEYIRWIKSLDAKQRNKTRDTFDEHIRIFDHVLRRLNYYDKDKAIFNKYFDIYQSLGLNK